MAEVGLASEPFKLGSETSLTYDLKMASWAWLYREAGCRVIGLEVKLEGPEGRIVDLAGVGPRNTFYIIEVKSSKSDCSRDNHTMVDHSDLRGLEDRVSGRTNLAKETLRQAMDYAKQISPESWRDVPAFKQALLDYRRVSGKEESYWTRTATYLSLIHI